MRPKVRVLIVTNDWLGVVDGGFLQWADQSGPDRLQEPEARQFHLGEFLRVLTQTSWVGFDLELTRAHRAKPGPGETEAQIKARSGADVAGFRFDTPFQVGGATRSLSDYDMVLFFPIDPSPQADETDASLAAEAAAIAAFMEAGGGFFGTGDHENLGAPLSQLIPRVRSMRRWWYSGDEVNPSPPGPNGEPPAPSAVGPDRHDTTQPEPGGVLVFENQSDAIAQPIEPTMYGAGLTVKSGYLARRYLPHPLLCSPDGVVRFLPDHMHEGWCEVPSDLTRSFTAGGSSHAEYPPATSETDPLAPEIVATGQALAHATPVIDDVHSPAGTATPTTFGVIGAWDGHRAAKGRVVVDSTWHHFFNINLTGDLFLENPADAIGAGDQRRHGFFVVDPVTHQRTPNDQYKMIQWYYRNIIYWLIPAGRRAHIFWQLATDISRLPRLAEELAAFERPAAAHVATRGDLVRTLDRRPLDFGAYLYFGQLAEAYLSQARGACALFEIQVILYKPKIPWWEWVEEIVDVWDPVVAERNPQLGELRVLGALGLAPRPEALLQASLGAAVLAATRLRRQTAQGRGIDVEALEKAWHEEFALLSGQVDASLRRAADLTSAFSRLTALSPAHGRAGA